MFGKPSAKWDRSLKLMTVTRVRHSSVSLHRVELLSSFRFSWLSINVIPLGLSFYYITVIYFIYVHYVQLGHPKSPRVAPLPWSGAHVLLFFPPAGFSGFSCPALVRSVFGSL